MPDAGKRNSTPSEGESVAGADATRRRVVVADNDHRILELLIHLLEEEFEIVAHASNGEGLVAAVGQYAPDLAIVDISMPVLNGIEATRIITGSGSTTQVIILSIHSEVAYVEAAFEAGALGYVLKSDAHADLVPAIKTVLGGRVFRSVGLP